MGSLSTLGIQQSWRTQEKIYNNTPIIAKKSNFALFSFINVPDKDLTVLGNKKMSCVYVITQFLQTHDSRWKMDYKASTEAYNNYWVVCINAYVFLY